MVKGSGSIKTTLYRSYTPFGVNVNNFFKKPRADMSSSFAELLGQINK